MKNIEEFVAQGYELVVCKSDWRDAARPFHALVLKDRDTASSHNFLGASVTEAIEGLDKYLARFTERRNGDA